MGLEPASSTHTPSPDYRNVVLIFDDYVGDWTILRGVRQHTSLPVAAGLLGCLTQGTITNLSGDAVSNLKDYQLLRLLY